MAELALYRESSPVHMDKTPTINELKHILGFENLSKQRNLG